MSKARMALLYKIKKDLLNGFYKNQEQTKQEELCKIAITNRQLLRANAPTFMFEGKWYADFYPFNPNPQNVKGLNRILDPSLREQVQDLVHNHDFEDLENQAQLSNLIGNVLAECRQESDIRALLPSTITNGFCLSFADFQTFSNGSLLTPEEIQKIKEQNAAGYQCLNRITLTRLLMPT